MNPFARNSCAAIAAGCLQALSRDKDAVVLVLSADHHIPDREAFGHAVSSSLDDVAQGYLMTFGVKPNHPATGFGYIKPGEALLQARKVVNFTEKPDAERAAGLIATGHLWNSGNFLFLAERFMDELHHHEKTIHDAVNAALSDAQADLDFIRLDEDAFAKATGIAVDRAVFEKTDKAAVMPVSYEWSDIGSWDELIKVMPADADGNVAVGDVAIIGGEGNVVHSEGHLTALIGIEDTVVVSTRDVVLVMSKSQAEDVKTLVASLTLADRREANEALQMFRPWGNFEQLEKADGYQVKRITVRPGGVLSLQSHQHRSEHWVVVNGSAEVTIGEITLTLESNQSIYVPAGTKHRLANRGSAPIVLIEVQTGSYLGEDDITRFEDVYGR